MRSHTVILPNCANFLSGTHFTSDQVSQWTRDLFDRWLGSRNWFRPDSTARNPVFEASFFTIAASHHENHSAFFLFESSIKRWKFSDFIIDVSIRLTSFWFRVQVCHSRVLQSQHLWRSHRADGADASEIRSNQEQRVLRSGRHQHIFCHSDYVCWGATTWTQRLKILRL